MTEVKRTYYDDGTLQGEVTFVDGRLHGFTRHWHPNGVLESEIPLDHGVIDGTVKQWNDKGELIGSCEIRKGTGVYRTWYPNGLLMGETSLIDGKWTGRQRAYFEDGQLVAESFYLENEKVSRRRYLQACKADPRLPRYDDDQRPRSSRAPKARAAETTKASAQEYDTLGLKLLAGSDVREALSWLEESREPSRTLGEEMGQDASIQVIKKLYAYGALAVHAVEIQGAPDDHQNTGRLVIELPRDSKSRGKLLRFCGALAKQRGFCPDRDVGQRYLLIMLD